MVVGAKVCELIDDFLWFVCGNFDVSPLQQKVIISVKDIIMLT